MHNQRGFTLIETMIAFIVLVFGLLGAIALQAKAKQATYDSLQRAAALGVANDVIERVQANPQGAMAGAYNVTINSTDNVDGNFASCLNAQCTSGQIAAYDAEQWRRAIRAVDNTGSLADAMLCVTTAGGADQVDITVTVSWASRQELGEAADASAAKGNCGGTGDRRRVLTLNSFTFV